MYIYTHIHVYMFMYLHPHASHGPEGERVSAATPGSAGGGRDVSRAAFPSPLPSLSALAALRTRGARVRPRGTGPSKYKRLDYKRRQVQGKEGGAEGKRDGRREGGRGGRREPGVGSKGPIGRDNRCEKKVHRQIMTPATVLLVKDSLQ